ncbi:MAG: MarR family transcriptional regulator [Myxococcales bacterium]|nr:MarR family transcriptional regulator [Myxococcales bacterium]MDD9965823.1 MarR family transcriptional regulator [Myxococcales bacterium]
MKQVDTDDITSLILEVFRLNGALTAAGDRLVGDLGLSSARWQVMGAVALAPAPLTVPGIARDMGLTRQSVRRVVRELVSEGILALEPNRAHRRSHLVVLTRRGARLYSEASARQRPWAAALAQDVPARSLVLATNLVRTLRERLEEST